MRVCVCVELALNPCRRQVGWGMAGHCSSHPTLSLTPLLLQLLVGIVLRRPPSLCIRSLFFPVYFHPILGWRGFCLSRHLCITPPNAERRRGMAGFSEGRGKGEGAGAKQKGKMVPLPGLMNEANGRSQWSELRSCSQRQSISWEPRRGWQRRGSGTAGSFKSPNK